jgi:hypothetical protein
VPIQGVDGGGLDAYQDLVIFRGRFFDLDELKDIGRAILIAESSFHGIILLGGSG